MSGWLIDAFGPGARTWQVAQDGPTGVMRLPRRACAGLHRAFATRSAWIVLDAESGTHPILIWPVRCFQYRLATHDRKRPSTWSPIGTIYPGEATAGKGARGPRRGGMAPMPEGRDLWPIGDTGIVRVPGGEAPIRAGRMGVRAMRPMLQLDWATRSELPNAA